MSSSTADMKSVRIFLNRCSRYCCCRQTFEGYFPGKGVSLPHCAGS
ncbi:hypothetical protein OROGR_029411 [Orobanche gracilis]